MEVDGFVCSYQLMPNCSKYYFYPYQLPPTPYLRRSKLTGCGVIFFFFNWLIIFWSRGAGKLFMGDSSSRHSINARTHGVFLLALFLDKGVTSSSAHFFSYIYLTSFSSFPYFNFSDPFKRDLTAFAFARLSFAYVNLLLTSLLLKPFFFQRPLYL